MFGRTQHLVALIVVYNVQVRGKNKHKTQELTEKSLVVQIIQKVLSNMFNKELETWRGNIYGFIWP